jgi:hypothetical protein
MLSPEECFGDGEKHRTRIVMGEPQKMAMGRSLLSLLE